MSNRINYYKLISDSIKDELETFLGMDCAVFNETYSDLHYLICIAYHEGKISNVARKYFMRLLRSYLNSYIEIIDNDINIRKYSKIRFC